MKTTVATWSEVAGSYDLDFGKAIPQHPSQRLKPRGFWGDIENVGKDALDAAQGNADLSKSVTFDVDVGKPRQKTNIYTDDKGRFSIDCIDCYIAGSWQVQGHIKVDGFTLQDLTLETSPSNFEAKLELEATVTSSKEPDSLQESKEIFSAPIPGAGIAVTGIFKLGATVSYDVGTSATFAGSATADFGVKATLPNGAKVVADINNPSNSAATGWTGSSLDPIFEVTKLSASITLAAYSQPKIAFGIELIEVGNVDVAITMKLPEISSTLSASYGTYAKRLQKIDAKILTDKDGACGAGTSKTGVKLENKADESLSLQIDLDLGDDDKKPSWSQSLVDFSQPLGSDCIPLSIPGLGPDTSTSTSSKSPAASSSSSSPATCSPPNGSGMCQKTSETCVGGDYISGYCPGDDSIKCCPNSSASSSKKAPSTAPKTCKPPGKTGICQKTSTTCAGGDYISGYCPGDDSIKCCPDATSTSTTKAVSSKPTTCNPPGKKGTCQKISKTCAGGSYISGYCPGDEEIKCCPDVATPKSTTAGRGGCKTKKDRFGKRMLIC